MDTLTALTLMATLLAVLLTARAYLEHTQARWL
jgi:hypothetical protein